MVFPVTAACGVDVMIWLLWCSAVVDVVGPVVVQSTHVGVVVFCSSLIADFSAWRYVYTAGHVAAGVPLKSCFTTSWRAAIRRVVCNVSPGCTLSRPNSLRVIVLAGSVGAWLGVDRCACVPCGGWDVVGTCVPPVHRGLLLFGLRRFRTVFVGLTLVSCVVVGANSPMFLRQTARPKATVRVVIVAFAISVGSGV